jgi:hypothetical protein
MFSLPHGVSVDSFGNVFVGDTQNHRIRKITSSGAVTTLTGAGDLHWPVGVFVDAFGSVYVSDNTNNRIRKVSASGIISTVIGGTGGFNDGTGTSVRFSGPIGITADSFGNMYVSDYYNHRIRKITLDGKVSTLAGTGVQGVLDGLGTVAKFDGPLSIALLRSKTVVVGQLGGSTIRQITPTVIKVSAPAALTVAGVVTLEVTGLDPGVVYYYRAIATSVGGLTRSATPNLPIGTAFTVWQVANFGPDAANPLISGPGASPTGDHVSNLLKYALGIDPNERLQPNDPRLPALAFDATPPGYLTLTVRPDPAVTNVRLFFETSTDMANWTSVGVSSAINPLGDLTGSVPYVPSNNPPPKRYLRLGVELLLP